MKADSRLDGSPLPPPAEEAARLRDEQARLQAAVIDTLRGVLEEQRHLLLDQTAEIVELRRLLKLRDDLLIEQRRAQQAKDDKFRQRSFGSRLLSRLRGRR
jgi:hypothetical protein